MASSSKTRGVRCFKKDAVGWYDPSLDELGGLFGEEHRWCAGQDHFGSAGEQCQDHRGMVLNKSDALKFADPTIDETGGDWSNHPLIAAKNWGRCQDGFMGGEQLGNKRRGTVPH